MTAEPSRYEVDDRDAVRALLRRDAIANAYMLGDLDDAQRDLCRWYGAWARPGELAGLLLVYDGYSVPAIMTTGSAEAIEEVLDATIEELPGRALAQLQADHIAAVDRHYACEHLRPYVRMGLRAAELVSFGDARVRLDRDWSLEALGHRDTGELFALYRFYPDNYFEPAQLGSGHYYGVRVDGELVSVAGVHVLSPEFGVACLGNIVTHPDLRGHGLSSLCTSHLCERLIAGGVDTLALNVARHNRSAVRVYERLGFRHHTTYVEGMVTRGLNEQLSPPEAR